MKNYDKEDNGMILIEVYVYEFIYYKINEYLYLLNIV